MLRGSRQVAVAAVGQFNGKGILKRTAGLDLQPDLREDLERYRRDTELADTEHLHHATHRLGLGIARGESALRIGTLQGMLGG